MLKMLSTGAAQAPRRALKNKLLGGFALIAASAMVLTGCSTGGAASEDEGGAAVQSLRFGLSGEPIAPITGAIQGAVASTMLTMVHRGLMAYDSKGELIPALAESLETPDDTTYVFTLHPDLTFHDGSPLTAANVKSSIEYYADPANGTGLVAGFADIASVETEGDNVVTITLSAPNTAFLQYLAIPTAAIVPDASLNSETPNWIGAGPFELVEHEEGVSLTVERNEDYYAADTVALDEIEFLFYADGEARTNALLSGDVDMIDYVPWENFERVGSTEGITMDAKPGPFQYVQFNVTDGPFADPKVREAVAYAINRENAVLAAFQNNGEPLNGVVIPESDPAFDTNAGELWEYDPEKAKQLLKEAGYADGFSATLLTTSQYTFLQDTALSVQEDLRAIGIAVELDSPDWSTRVSKGGAGEYDLAVSGDTGIITDPSYLLNYVSGNESFNTSWGYKNDEMVGLIEQGLRASDPDAKHEIYQDILGLIKTDVPFASATTRDQAFAFSDSVEGFSNLPGFLTFYSGYSLVDTSIAE